MLKSRAEFVRNARRRWWESAWPRNKERLRSAKVIGVHRTDRGRFAFDLEGTWQSGKGGVIVTTAEPAQGASIPLLAGYLNSELLDLWYGVRGRTARDIWRDYEPKPMSGIPYRHVDLPGRKGGREVKALKAALKKGDVEKVSAQASASAGELRSAGDAGLAVDAPEAIEAARALELIVEAVAENRRALLPYRARFPELSRVVKDPWSREVVDPVAGEFVAALPEKSRASVRVDPELEAAVHTDGTLGKVEVEGAKAVFRYRRQVVAEVDGPVDKLVLLVEVLSGATQLTPKDLLALELPRDVDAFKAEVGAATAEVARLLAEGNVLVEVAERLVCALYGVPAELEDEIVAHAVARANPPSPER